MNNVKSDEYFLNKIIVELTFIMEYTKDKSIYDIENDVLLLKSIMFSLIQISENNDKLSDEFKQKYKNISWKAMKGMRNRIVHDYGGVDIKIVYQTIKVSVPEFYIQMKSI